MTAWVLDPQNAHSLDNANVLTMQIPVTLVAELVGMEDLPLDEHIAPTINPVMLWSFEDCIKSDIKNCEVIANIPDKL